MAVDAGHGGEDPGAHGPGGTLEKNVTLAVARELAAQINKQPGMKAVLTRDGDYLHSAQAALPDRAREQRRPVRVDPRRCVHQRRRQGLVGVGAVAARQDQRSGALAGRPREPRRPDRRRLARRQGRQPGRGAARPAAGLGDAGQRRRSPATCSRRWPGWVRPIAAMSSAPTSWCCVRRTCRRSWSRPPSSAIRPKSASCAIRRTRSSWPQR